MILPDANLLLYSVNSKAPLHRSATLSGSETVGFSWVSLLAFLRVSTNPIFAHPLPVDRAFAQVERWLGQSAAAIVHPGPSHARILRQLLRLLGTAGNLISDA